MGQRFPCTLFCPMSDFFAIEFPFVGESAWQAVSSILRAGNCPMPSAYREEASLLLVWHYERNGNECAWEPCHHILHMLLYEKMLDMTRFYNEYKTQPILYSSERLYRVLRFGVPHGFMSYGEQPSLQMDGLVPLHECEWDAPAFQRSTHVLLERTLDRCSRAELSSWDTSLLYLSYKRIEAMAITCDYFGDEVEKAMDALNAAICKQFE